MKWTEEEKRQFILRVDIGRARRLYDEGKNAEEIAAVVRRPVALMEKWIRNFKIIDQKRQARNGGTPNSRAPDKGSCVFNPGPNRSPCL